VHWSWEVVSLGGMNEGGKGARGWGIPLIAEEVDFDWGKPWQCLRWLLGAVRRDRRWVNDGVEIRVM
jgi:hypothetical protein